MKQTKYIFAAALAVLALGCNKEQVAVDGTPDGEEVAVTFAAELPGTVTKAIGDGLTAKNLSVAVYDDASNAAGTHIVTLDKTAVFDALHTTVEYSLVKGKTYHFIFWAQAEGAPYTFDPETKKVAIDYTAGAANDEKRDAFYAVKTLKVTGPATEPVQLHRPFAQVNFGTSDSAAATAAGVTPTASLFTATDAASSFDVFAGEGKDPVRISFTEAALPAEQFTLKDGTTYTYLAMNYFIPTGKLSETHVSNLSATFKGASDDVVISVPSAKVQANYRTNIVGNLLTDQVVFNVEIVPAFEQPDEDIDLQNISKLSALKAFFANGGTAKLVENITVDETLAVPAGKEVILDLNGHEINNAEDLWNEATGDWSLVSVRGGSLTIKGDGLLKAKENDCYAVDVQDGGHVIIEDGEYISNVHAVYVWVGTAEIRGGKYSVQQKFSDPTKADEFVLNCYDAHHRDGTAKIIVTGGEFVSFNPADCWAEGAHTNFCAPGYKSKKISDNPEVWTVVDASAVFTKEEFVAAATANVENIVIKLQNDIEFGDGARVNEWEIGGADTKTVTIEGTGNELLTYANDYRSYLKTVNPNATLILKNLKMTSTFAPGTWDTYNIIFATPVEMENVTFNKAIGFDMNCTYAVLNNVVIDESANNVRATYAMWVSPKCEMNITMNNCEIRNTAFTDGRAIKIDEQYVSNPQKVTLTVNGGKFAASSTSKALINVKNNGGNVITTTGNIDITGIPSGKMVATDIAGTVTYNGVQM